MLISLCYYGLNWTICLYSYSFICWYACYSSSICYKL